MGAERPCPVGGIVNREYRELNTCAKAGEAGRATLIALGLELEEDLAQLVELLQEERRLVAAFEVEELTKVVELKAELVTHMQRRTETRRAEASAAWASCQPETALPERMPDALAQLASSDPRGVCASLSSRLDALLDVVSELHRVNRDAVKRTLGWLDSAVDEMRANPSGTYGANGRRASAGSAALRKVV